MRGLRRGLAVNGRGADINQTLGNLGAISDNGRPVLSVLAEQAPQLHDLVTTSQHVFTALSSFAARHNTQGERRKQQANSAKCSSRAFQ